MIRFVTLLTSLGFVVSPDAVAQRFEVDGSLGYGSHAWRVAASSQWHLRAGRLLELGAGARLTYYGGDAMSYRNQAPRLPRFPPGSRSIRASGD